MKSKTLIFSASDYASGSSPSGDDTWALGRYPKFCQNGQIFGTDGNFVSEQVSYVVTGGQESCRFMTVDLSKDQQWLSGSSDYSGLFNKCSTSGYARYPARYMGTDMIIGDPIYKTNGSVFWSSADPSFAQAKEYLKYTTYWGGTDYNTLSPSGYELNGVNVLMYGWRGITVEINPDTKQLLWATKTLGAVTALHKLSNGKILAAKQSELMVYDPSTDTIETTFTSSDLNSVGISAGDCFNAIFVY